MAGIEIINAAGASVHNDGVVVGGDIRPLDAPRPRGRTVPGLPAYTFSDSGITVHVRRLSPMTMQRVTDALTAECKRLPDGNPHKYPEPPVQMVAVGGGEPKPTPNPTDPDYKKAIQQWAAWAGEEQGRRLLRLVAVEYLVVDPATVSEEAARVRRILEREGVAWEDIPRYTREENDRILYLEHVCYGSPADMERFVTYVATGNTPQEAQIAAATAAFRAAGE